MKPSEGLGIMLIFLIVVTALLTFYDNKQMEKPLGGVERASPSDFIKAGDIRTYPDRVVISVEGASLSRYADTNSMDPVIDKEATGIEVIPKSADEISMGDIVSFESGNGIIVHRVVEKGFDENGFWFITKGDNSLIADEKIYFDKIHYKTIGVLW